MKFTIIFSAFLCFSACSTTDPGSSAGIDYRLPRTDAKITLGIDVLQCDDDAARPLVVIKSSLKIDAVAGVRDGYWHISGSELSSDVTKLGLTIDVDENGVISSVNASSANQSAVILGNIIKLAATAVSLAAAPASDNVKVVCNDKTRKALANAKILQNAINGSSNTVIKTKSERSSLDAGDNVNTLASRLATAKLSLHRDISASIHPENVAQKANVVVAFPQDEFSELFDTAYDNRKVKNDQKGMNEDSMKLFDIEARVESTATSSKALIGSVSGTLSSCAESIVLPRAAPVKFVLTPKGKLFDVTLNETVSETLYVSQMSSNSELCISTGFGENRVVGLKFDKFGRVTEFSWSSEARAANITGAMAGAAPDTAAIVKTFRDAELTKDKAELDRLTTEQNLIKARQCQAILDSGGTSCSK